ncbi:MFS transporter [Rhizorhabdus dicambivorans]|uniref:MFS transporter n=1 Tax=Rhizorhabdus dicambivorans TaxID=1850238 RepID=A0A2A4FUJ5_9SPHN|nr:MFS transporter [Rhizorhabdus dicambivorans]ATE66162.1 MFS transporter [Rhizorhabdus dicambivorans]PCE42088.1 MFS transporter [Rhizorhabdus dicambivorans]
MTQLSLPAEKAEIGASAGVERSGLTEWREGFPLVITSFFGIGVAVLSSWSIGLFIEPIQDEFGWGRGQITAGLVVLSIIGFFAAPFAGRLIDLIGTRKIGLIGMVVYSTAIASLGTTGAHLWQWWALWIFLSIGYVMVKPTLWAVAVSRRFDSQRGLALAVTNCGSGAILIVMPTILTVLIADHGWRMSYLFLGIGVAVLTLPLMLLFLRDPAPGAAAARLRMAGARPAGAADDAEAKAELWASLRSGRFLRLLLCALILTIALIGLQVHFIPMIVGLGVDRTTAAMIAGMIGLGSIIGRLTCGFMMDRYRGQIVGAAFLALPALSSVFLLSYDGGLAMGCAIAFIQGLALGAEMDVMTYLTSRYFGLRNYGTLMGTIMGVLVLGNGVGPTLAGWVYDITGSYQLYVMGAIPAFLVSALLIASLGDYSRGPRGAH